MEIHSFFLILALVLISARLFSELFATLNIPPVMGELLAGIVLGSSVLGIVEPNDVLRLLAEIGIILLLFEVGLETDLKRLAIPPSSLLPVRSFRSLSVFSPHGKGSGWIPSRPFSSAAP